MVKDSIRFYQFLQMGDEECSSNSSNQSFEHQPAESSSVKEENAKKPSVPLSFSIARLINKAPEQASERSNQRPTASAPSINPVYPIPIWPPVSTASAPVNSRLPVPSEHQLNQMLIRGVLQQHHSSGFSAASETVMVTLMRHYQQFYGQHHPASQQHSLLAGNLIPPSALMNGQHPLLASSGNNVAHMSNLHKVEILRSAAAAASLHHHHNRPATSSASHGKLLGLITNLACRTKR